jgi:hypothetical protein
VFSYEAGHLKDSFGILCSFYSGWHKILKVFQNQIGSFQTERLKR